MKRIKLSISLLLIVSMLGAISMTGCSAKTDNNMEVLEESINAEEDEEEAEETEAEVEETEAAPTTTPKPTATPKPTVKPTSTPTPSPTPSWADYEFTQEAIDADEQAWIDYATTGLEKYEITDDTFYGRMQLADAMNGTAYFTVMTKKYFTADEIYEGAIIHPWGGDWSVEVGPAFEADLNCDGISKHIVGYSIVDSTRFDSEGNLDVRGKDENGYWGADVQWLAYDEDKGGYTFESYMFDDDVGYNQEVRTTGYVLLEISPDVEIFINGAMSYIYMDDEFQVDFDELVDDRGNTFVVYDGVTMQFVPHEGSNHLYEFADYMVHKYNLSMVMQLDYVESMPNNPYSGPSRIQALPASCFVHVEGGVVTQIYFPNPPSGSVHWQTPLGIFGTLGSGEYYFDPM